MSPCGGRQNGHINRAQWLDSPHLQLLQFRPVNQNACCRWSRCVHILSLNHGSILSYGIILNGSIPSPFRYIQEYLALQRVPFRPSSLHHPGVREGRVRLAAPSLGLTSAQWLDRLNNALTTVPLDPFPPALPCRPWNTITTKLNGLRLYSRR